MRQRDFEERINKEKLRMKDYDLEIGKPIKAAYILGIYNDNGVWKIYITKERDLEPYICKVFSDENAAFDNLYERVKLQIKVENQ